MELRPTQSGLAFGELISRFRADLRSESSFDSESTHLFVRGISVDSRRVRPGDLFAALPGVNAHGARFVEEALAAGAVAVMTDTAGIAVMDSLRSGLPAVLVFEDPRSAVGEAAAQIYGRPGDDLLLFGVTGTNGKTTTTWMLEHALRASGHVTGLIGTVETQIAGEPVASVRTTPEAPELHALLAVMKERNVTAVAVEVSSHAMTMGRIDGCVFDVVGFTQFGTDHLDFHGTESEYFNAKRSLFDRRHAKAAAICVDSEGGIRVAGEILTSNLAADADSELPLVTVATSEGQELPIDWLVADCQPRGASGYQFEVRGASGKYRAEIRSPGRFNVANTVVAAAMLDLAGLDIAATLKSLGDFPGVPGRMETIDSGQPFVAIVDYAHTPDALAAVLTTLRVETNGRLMVAFGCGGDRDPSKRKTMGEIAARMADVVIVTDDNPRSESPEAIRREILRGAFASAGEGLGSVREVPGRATAVRELVALARPADVLVLAGKGHEQGQEIDGHIFPFDDRAVLTAALARRRAAEGATRSGTD